MSSQPPPYPPYRQPPPPATSAFPIAIVLGVGCIAIAPVMVAVIGILAAIAIPNFLKFQCKAKQSEAKTNLSGIWVSEKVFYGEYGYYTSDLKALGWTPDGSPLYLYGFAYPGPGDDLPDDASVPADYDEERSDTSDPSVLGGSYSTLKMRDLNGSLLSARDFPAHAEVGPDTFVAAAIGDVDTDPGGYSDHLDVWTIDENKRLISVKNDCTN